MTQTVIGVFDNPDAAYEAEEALLQQGIEESSFHLATQAESGQQGQSMDEIRSFLQELFGPENTEEIDNYAEEIRRGGALLSVDLPDDKAIEAVQDAMLDAGAIDMDDLVEQWRQEEEARFSGEESQEEGQSVPIVEEQMEVGKGQVSKGTVRVIAKMAETPVEEDIDLKEEHATIARRPVDRPASPEELEAQGEKSIEIEETAEKPVIQKSARVVEELEVGKETNERTRTVQGSERHTEVEVERQPAKGGKGKRAKK